MRLSAIFSLLLVVATGFATFGVKYEVEGLLGHLARLRSDLAAEKNQIRVLRAEWNYLNRPDTLAALNRRYLSLVPVTQKQLDTAIADIPMREAVVAVAAASPNGAVLPPAAPRPAEGRAERAAAGTERLTPAKTIGELIASLAVAR
jgi:cell division protein FtsL